MPKPLADTEELVLRRPSLQCSKWAMVNSSPPVNPWGGSQENPIIFGGRQRSNWQQLLRQQSSQKEREVFAISTWQQRKLHTSWSHLCWILEGDKGNDGFSSYNWTNHQDYANKSNLVLVCLSFCWLMLLWWLHTSSAFIHKAFHSKHSLSCCWIS